MAKLNWKVLGVIATIATGALSIASSIIEDKNQDAKIKEEVRKALDN